MREKKLDLRIIKTRQNLFRTLISLMKDKSFEEIKVSDICSNSLINRSTFYSHFEDKYDLLSSLIEELKQSLQKELEKNKNISSSKDYYMEIIKLLLNHMEEKKDIYNAIMINNKNSIAMDMIYNTLNENIISRIKEDFNNNIPSDFIAKFYLGAIFNVGMEWIKDTKKYTKEDIITYLEQLIPSM